jgi:hypothetical protein
MSEQPVRMHLDPELDAELRATLDAARTDRVEDDRVERLALRLGPLLGPGGGGGTGGSGGSGGSGAAKLASTAATSGGVIAAAKGLALVVALGAAGTFVWIERAAPDAEMTTLPEEVPTPATTSAQEPPREPMHVEIRPPEIEPVSDPPSTFRRRTEPRAATTTPTSPTTEPPTTEPPTTAPPTTAPPTTEPPTTEPPTTEPPTTAPPTTEAPTTAPPTTEAPTTAPTELSLVRGAMSALAASPARALAQADEHARLYPHGALADDREVIAIDALVRLGRPQDAEARAGRFRTDHPGSPSIRRIDRILAR